MRKPDDPKHKHVDNRYLWGQKVQMEELQYLKPLIGWYVSIEQTSVSVEQSLATTKRLLEAHCGPLLETGSTIDDLLTCTLGGPTCIEEVCSKHQSADLRFNKFLYFGVSSVGFRTSSCSSNKVAVAKAIDNKMNENYLGMTRWTRAWAGLWLANFGRRFALYRPRVDRGQQRLQPVPGSEKSVIARRRHGVEKLLAARPDSKVDRNAQKTIACAKLGNVVADHKPQDRDGLKKFRSTTLVKKSKHLAPESQQLAGLRRGCLTSRAGDEVILEAKPKWHVVNAVSKNCPTLVQDRARCMMRAWKNDMSAFLPVVDFVVVADVNREVLLLSANLPQPKTLHLALLVVALGGGVLNADLWNQRCFDVRRPGKCLMHNAAALEVERCISLSQRFKKELPDICLTFSKLAALEKSKWSVRVLADGKKPDVADVFLNSPTDLSVFIQNTRRLDKHPGVECKYLSDKKPAPAVKPLRTALKEIFSKSTVLKTGKRSFMGPPRPGKRLCER